MEEIALEEVYKAFRWEERLKGFKKIPKTKISTEERFRILRGCLVAFSAYIILALITLLLNNLLYYVSEGATYLKCIELFLIIIVPSMFLGLAFMLPTITQK